MKNCIKFYFLIISLLLIANCLFFGKAFADNMQGSFDEANCDGIKGWVCDAENPNQGVVVYVFDGPDDGPPWDNLIGRAYADQPGETAIGNLCKDTTNHRFNFAAPDDGVSHDLYLYAVNNNGTRISLGNKKFNSCGFQVSSYCENVNGSVQNNIISWSPIKNANYAFIDNIGNISLNGGSKTIFSTAKTNVDYSVCAGIGGDSSAFRCRVTHVGDCLETSSSSSKTITFTKSYDPNVDDAHIVQGSNTINFINDNPNSGKSIMYGKVTNVTTINNADYLNILPSDFQKWIGPITGQESSSAFTISLKSSVANLSHHIDGEEIEIGTITVAGYNPNGKDILDANNSSLAKNYEAIDSPQNIKIKVKFVSNSIPNPSIKGIFIANKIVFSSNRNLNITYDSAVVNNPPPGFADLLRPDWQELVP